jgi:hypothetical protein
LGVEVCRHDFSRVPHRVNCFSQWLLPPSRADPQSGIERATMAGAQLIAAQRVPAATFPGLRFVTRTHVSGTSFHRSSNQGKIRKSAANGERTKTV